MSALRSVGALGMRACCALLAGLAMCLAFSHAAAAVTVVRDAQITTTIDGQSTLEAHGTLPYHWDRRNGERDGYAHFVAEVAIPQLSEPMALYIPRLGNSYRVSVNGHELDRFGSMPPDRYEDSTTQPRYWPIPADWLTQRTTIEITIAATGGRWGGLSTLVVGSPSEVRRDYLWDYALEVSLRRVLVVATLVLGLLALVLWMRQRDNGYLYYGAAELLWSAVCMRQLFEQAPLPWPFWGYFVAGAFALAVPLQLKFALIVIGKDSAWQGRFNALLLAFAVPAVALGAVVGMQWMVPIWRMLLMLDTFLVTVTILAATMGDASLERKALAVAAAVVVVATLRDTMVLTFSSSHYPGGSWLRFAWTGFGIAFALIIAERMRKANAELAAMNRGLAEQLDARSAELARAYERERANDIENGAMQERQRLMRDLHDGLGSHLVGVLRMAQQDATSKQDVTNQLRQAVDQLKITVDALQETDGDIPSLLGAVRYRLARRLNAAGIDLQWEVGHLPFVENWGVRQSFELQMILLEVFTNMMVHSGATEAKLTARQVGNGEGAQSIAIEVFDNGRGFSVASDSARGGKGIANMHLRAAAIGATLSFTSEPSNTCTRIDLPCHGRGKQPKRG